MPAFPDPATDRTRPLGSIEPAVHWLSESTRPEAAAARATVNAWYAAFPDPQGRFAARLRSEDTVEHLSAVDELHVHHLLRQHHADVRYEEGGIGPDFRMYSDGACLGGVEVLSLFQPADWTADERQHGRIADEINARVKPTAGYFVDLAIEHANRDPAPRRMARFIQTCLEELPPPEELMQILPSHPLGTDLPIRVYEEDAIRIRARFIPMFPNAPARTDPDARIVGSGPIIGGMVTTSERMRERIASKAGGRYDIAHVPFAVAVCIHDSFADDHELLSALYGRETVTMPGGQRTRDNDGLFGVDKQRPTGRNRRVSAVAIVNWLRLWEADAVDIAILPTHLPSDRGPTTVCRPSDTLRQCTMTGRMCASTGADGRNVPSLGQALSTTAPLTSRVPTHRSSATRLSRRRELIIMGEVGVDRQPPGRAVGDGTRHLQKPPDRGTRSSREWIVRCRIPEHDRVTAWESGAR